MKTLEEMIADLIDENAKLKLENLELKQKIRELTEATQCVNLKQ